jgi:hypothetical protein
MKMQFLLTKNNKEKLISLIGNLDAQQIFDVTIIEHGGKRSSAQNKRYWDLLSELGNHLGYNSEEMHKLMSYKFLSETAEIMGDKITVIPSTTSLGIKDFKNYMDRIENFASSFGVVYSNKTGLTSVKYKNIKHNPRDFQDFQDG